MKEAYDKVRFGCSACQLPETRGEGRVCETCGRHYCAEHEAMAGDCCETEAKPEK